MENKPYWLDYEEKRIYRFSKVSLQDYKLLAHQGYKLTWQWDIYGKKALYLIKPGLKESTEHFFLVYNITGYLRKHKFLVWNYKTVKPDIIFQFKNKKIAIEVETGKNLRSSRKQFEKKVDCLDDNFGWDWLIVVTNRNLVKKYKKYGSVFTRKNIKRKLDSMLKIRLENHM